MFGFHGWMGEGFDGRHHNFSVCYSCFSVSMCPNGDKRALEDGGKIILPPSALDTLTKLNVVYPMLFKLSNPKTNTSTHCGVLEFVADEGHMYIPYWMMRNLLLDQGDEVRIESVNLPVATFSRFEPQSTDFLVDISNPKAALEFALRNFACLTKGDVVAIAYNDKVYELRVLEVNPNGAASIIECDMRVDFAPPVGYEETSNATKGNSNDDQSDNQTYAPVASFSTFGGSGNRLDGKASSEDKSRGQSEPQRTEVGVPDYEWQYGTLILPRGNFQVPSQVQDTTSPEPFNAFKGQGRKLRGRA